MGWADLLAKPDDCVTVPWTGGRAVRGDGRSFKVKGKLPPEHGWHEFSIDGGRIAKWKGEAEADWGLAERFKTVDGYLVGNRLIIDGSQVLPDPTKIVEQSVEVRLTELGLPRFSRIKAIVYEDDTHIYIQQEFPLGPEGAVQTAYEDRKDSVLDIPDVTPALDLAFRLETWQRAEAEEQRRLLAERLRKEAEELALAERRAALQEQIGTGEGRRALAKVDFGAAATAALAVAGAQLLDHRLSRNKGETVVDFRFRRQRFQCVVETDSLRIVDAGICLINHGTGERGDNYFTLESLPAVIGQAIDEGRLVLFRHVGGDGNNWDDGGW
jgi:hypothetical protein